MTSTTSSRTHEQVQQPADCWNDWNSPTLIHHHSASFNTPMRAMEGKAGNLCRRKKQIFLWDPHCITPFLRSACLLTAGGQEQHQFYRSEPHQQGAGPPVMMQQETCDKSSVSPTPTTTASHNNNNNSLSSGMSPLGGGNHSGDQSSVTKEERTSRQRGQSSPSPSKSAFLSP
jgi:hypothetical protein